jgi:hypothetical protein
MTTTVIEAFVDNVISVTGASNPVSGVTNGSTVISCNDLYGNRVRVIRGIFPIISFDPGGGVDYYTKFVVDTFLTLNNPLVAGEYIYIKTIPV